MNGLFSAEEQQTTPWPVFTKAMIFAALLFFGYFLVGMERTTHETPPPAPVEAPDGEIPK